MRREFSLVLIFDGQEHIIVLFFFIEFLELLIFTIDKRVDEIICLEPNWIQNYLILTRI